jgi:UDP-N-acetylmuramate--alanine ligase
MTKRQPFMNRIRKVHMVGIGGIGMSSIAEVLLRRGYEVTGSDLRTSEVTEHLEQVGARIFEGHDPAHVRDTDVVVYSSAVDPDNNVETLQARDRRIPLINRSVMLAELMRMKFGIGIAGTHGKTTTTTLTGLVVARGGFDPTVVVGGKVAAFGSNAVFGEGDIIIVEADEYDRTFLRLTPAIAVITTIDVDHLDTYRDLEDICRAFVSFGNSVPFFGAVVACTDDDNVRSALPGIERHIVTYGLNPQADLRATDVLPDGLTMSFRVTLAGTALGTIRLPLPGEHNVRNALAAVAVGLELGIPFAEIQRALEKFAGIQRRFEKLADSKDMIVVNDYAHHPGEVSATLSAARGAWPGKRIVAVFQPHLYSRTASLAGEFAAAFAKADLLVLAPIYGAREQPMRGVTSELIADEARRLGQSVFVTNARSDVPDAVARLAEAGDAVIVMGAGDIWREAHELAHRVQKGETSAEARKGANK